MHDTMPQATASLSSPTGHALTPTIRHHSDDTAPTRHATRAPTQQANLAQAAVGCLVAQLTLHAVDDDAGGRERGQRPRGRMGGREGVSWGQDHQCMRLGVAWNVIIGPRHQIESNTDSLLQSRIVEEETMRS
jgi:hypothetical protein